MKGNPKLVIFLRTLFFEEKMSTCKFCRIFSFQIKHEHLQAKY